MAAIGAYVCRKSLLRARMITDRDLNKMISNRSVVLNKLANMIANLASTTPRRIAVDGQTASGKTTLADELAAVLTARGETVIRTSIDGFHRPKAERYARGRYSAEGYYFDARALPAIKALLLSPLGPGGDRRYRTASFDLERDLPIEQEPMLAPANAILIVDGTFLQRPELRSQWELAIFVETSEGLSDQRGIARDQERLGGVDAALSLYENRYRPAFEIYNRTCAPVSSADIVFNNDVFGQPHLRIRQSGGKLGSPSSRR